MASTFTARGRSNARRIRNQIKGNAKGNPDYPAEQTMRVFQPVNFLEPGEGHARIEFLIFGEALVVGEERLPRFLPERRQDADQRAPVHDRKAGVVETRDPPEHDHRQHETREHEQPIGDGAAVVRDPLRCDAAAAGGPEGRSVHACFGRSRRRRLQAR